MLVVAGSAEVGTIHDWAPAPGSVVTWHPSRPSLAKARQAPVSAVPPSYMQAQHLRGYVEFRNRGLDYSRAVIGSWDLPGRCDIRAMTHVINRHLRRHDTYRSWFEYTDDEQIIRHTISDPADINFVPTKHGEMTAVELRKLLLDTPDPLQWDCFSFGIIQHADHFTVYGGVDHLHCDPGLLAVFYVEIFMMYGALVRGAAPIPLPEPGSYDEYCIRQRESTSALTLDSPEVRRWIEFAESNDGTLPTFPLPLGDRTTSCGGGVLTARLMDEDQTARFESACISAGARFSGGIFAAVASAQYNLTGVETYHGITPVDRRSSPSDFLTTGWFTGTVPFSVPVSPSFGETARAAQASFDSNADLASVPFARVVELAPWLTRPGHDSSMLNFMDASLPPLSAMVSAQVQKTKAGNYCDGRMPAHFYMAVGRAFDETSIGVFFPDNPVARESVTAYIEAVKSVCHRIVEGHDAVVALRNVAQV